MGWVDGFVYWGINKLRNMIKVDFTVSDLSGKVIKTYALNLEPSQILIEVDNAREVWDEYHVRAKSDNPIAPFEVFKTKTYKQEMMERQYMLDLHDEVCDQDF
jgi:hypothetical protein